jgi:multisubunit Na+/H+ antiporter MnhE subunit
MKKETRLSMLVLAAFLIANQIFDMPHLLLGILVGVCLCFMIIGLLPEKYYDTIKQFKRKTRKTTQKTE